MFSKMKLAVVISVALLSTQVFAQQRPFPMAGKWVDGGAALQRPTNFTQAQMNQHVITRYTSYKSNLERVPGGNFYVRAGGTPAESRRYVTQSEAHGYGMMIFALMGDQANFDRLNTFRKNNRSTVDNRLIG